jgi:hypothetical protein
MLSRHLQKLESDLADGAVRYLQTPKDAQERAIEMQPKFSSTAPGIYTPPAAPVNTVTVTSFSKLFLEDKITVDVDQEEP